MSSPNPFRLFEEALDRARAAKIPEPEAAALATASTRGVPTVRMVLFRGLKEGGFAFFTNLGSVKAKELAANPRAALCFFWGALHEQVRVEGSVRPISEAEADLYWAGRPRGSQLAAWASDQSGTLPSRDLLLARVEEMKRRFGDGPVPRPEFWSGFVLVPERIEIWLGRPDRLHERTLFERDGESWSHRLLYP
jgi:pyridoxamine 5'-phosphate oxidase